MRLKMTVVVGGSMITALEVLTFCSGLLFGIAIGIIISLLMVGGES